MKSPHIPVLLDAVLEHLDIQPDDIVLDGTLGFGGHASAMLEKLGPQGRLWGIDQDPSALEYCSTKFADDPRVTLVHSNFAKAQNAIGPEGVNKILLDLGMSSFHLDSSGRGFSFHKEEPLDMRMNPTVGKTARQILLSYEAQALSDMFFSYGDLHQNKRLVEAIIATRKLDRVAFKTTTSLVDLIRECYHGPRQAMMRISSQVFQALRIEVNQEFQVLSEALTVLTWLLKPGGRMAVITFHSGEDRLVKQFVKAHSKMLQPLTKHVIQATQTEIRQNSRSKSAKLRVFEHAPSKKSKKEMKKN